MFSLLQPNQFLSATVLMAKHLQAYSQLDLVLGVLKTEFEKYLYLKSLNVRLKDQKHLLVSYLNCH